jgi:superfamily II DNA or RNA helicase
MLNFREPKEIQLRDYQSGAIEGLRQNIRIGKKRQILCAGTGAGKTLTAAHLLKEAHRKGSYALFIVDRVALVEQTSAVFDEYGIPHGVVQGIHNRFAPRENIQVCSAQTLARRYLPRDPDLIVVDEAHCQYKATLEFMGRYPDAVKIGLTATPFTAGMGKHWDAMVNVIPTRRLIDEGFLIEPKIYVAKSPDDADLIRNHFGEFTDESAASAGIKIVGDVVQEWIAKSRQHFGGPVKTIVFSPTVDHGRELCAAFSAAGFNFQQVSYLDKNDEERLAKIDEFRKPDSLIDGLVSCGVLTKGFDVPDVRIGVSCKPYRKSLSSHMQEIGRVMRPIPGEAKTALWLDHSGNIERFALDMYDVWENGAGELDKSEKRDSVARERDQKTREKVVCPECSGALRGNTCMACGWERPARSNIHAVEGELREFDSAALGLKARDGLRADCLKNPRMVWEAALQYCSVSTRKGDYVARRWAAGVWSGVYPGAKLPFGWRDMPIPLVTDQNAYALVEREVKRFRKTAAEARKAA